MALYGWHNCPMVVRKQIDYVSFTVTQILTTQLIGIYLHGSLAMGCFNPHHSDLDFLVITAVRIPHPAKQQILEFLLTCSQQPHPIEISFLAHSQVVPWQYLPPFDLHYSELWRDTYSQHLASGTWPEWNAIQQCDSDLAAHITVTNARGISITGAPITTTFPTIPDGDYCASIASDIHDSLEAILREPVSAILNCCRTYAYLREGHIFSKQEGGHWALPVLSANCRDTVRSALVAYDSTIEQQHFEREELLSFTTYMRQLLVPILQQRASA